MVRSATQSHFEWICLFSLTILYCSCFFVFFLSLMFAICSVVGLFSHPLPVLSFCLWSVLFVPCCLLVLKYFFSISMWSHTIHNHMPPFIPIRQCMSELQPLPVYSKTSNLALLPRPCLPMNSQKLCHLAVHMSLDYTVPAFEDDLLKSVGIC